MSKSNVLVYPVILILAFGIACTTGKIGTKNLTKENAGKIIEGQTTKTELFYLLGRPEQVTQTDEKGVGDILYKMTLAKTPVPQGRYEIWNYKIVYEKQFMLVPGGYHLERSGLFIINDRGIVVKMIIEEKKTG